MDILRGPFHPYLEKELIRGVRGFKEESPLLPLLILVPSDSLQRRLKILLAEEQQLCLLNLHLLTFHQLSRLLCEEHFPRSVSRLQEDPFFEEVLKHLIRAEGGGDSLFSPVMDTPGGCAALWQTLRDLKDGLVDPEVALSAIGEDHLGGGEREKKSALIALYKSLKQLCGGQGILDYTDLDVLAMNHVPSSGFLKQFFRVFYYGFYDLTQVQLDFFQRVGRHYPVTLFYPLVTGHPAWHYSQTFYERHIQGLITDRSRVQTFQETGEDGVPAIPLRLFRNLKEGMRTPEFPCSIIHCSGARDEVLTTAKEILKLATEEGYAFQEIGVVARSLTGYDNWIQELFPKHGIPLTGPLRVPLIPFPLTKVVLLLTQIAAEDYFRPRVIDLLSSPYFRAGIFCPEGIPPRPDLWDWLTRRAGIVKGVAEWRRLEKSGFLQTVSREREEDREEEDREPGIPMVSLQGDILWGIFSRLQDDLSALPAEASWSDYAACWCSLFSKYLGLGNSPGEFPATSPDRRVEEEVLRTLRGLAALEEIVPITSRDDFIRAFRTALERTSVPLRDEKTAGVAVMDAMSARGIAFKVLFLLGVNEGVFPRVIREDAFLRDGTRRNLETVLGYKIPEKMAGYEEEKLLFHLLISAARERLYVLYQRSDDAGRPLSPSWYVSELQRAIGADAGPVRSVPRGILEKKTVPPFDRIERLYPAEMAVRLSLESRDPSPALEAFTHAPVLYSMGRRTLDILDGGRRKLTSHDGLTGPLPDDLENVFPQGISPSALECYARCPFQFFSYRLLGLRTLERPEEVSGIPPSRIGSLCHDVLRDFHREWGARDDSSHFPGQAERWEDRETRAAALLREVCRKGFADDGWIHSVRYPVVREVTQERLEEWLRRMVIQDLRELSGAGYRPMALEVECRGGLAGDWPGDRRFLPLTGRFDRIDEGRDRRRYRVIDYKVKLGRTPGSEDKDLLRSAIRGRRLQPPFYQILAKQYLAERGREVPDSGIEVCLYYLAPEWPEGPLIVKPFPPEAWQGKTGAQLKATLSLLLEGISGGRFFILPGDHCEHCEVSTVCRKSHLPSRWRAEQDPTAAPHRALHREKANGN